MKHQAFLIFTLTRANADRLSWLYESADQQEALAVEVHSLCSFGAASVNLSQAISDSREFRVASWLLALLRERRGRGGPEIALDVIDRRRVEASHWLRQTNDAACAAAAPFADLVPTLIVEPDGCLTPFIYGFPRHWAVGHLDQGSLLDAAARWRERHGIRSPPLCESLWRVCGPGTQNLWTFSGSCLARPSKPAREGIRTISPARSTDSIRLN